MKAEREGYVIHLSALQNPSIIGGMIFYYGKSNGQISRWRSTRRSSRWPRAYERKCSRFIWNVSLCIHNTLDCLSDSVQLYDPRLIQSCQGSHARFDTVVQLQMHFSESWRAFNRDEIMRLPSIDEPWFRRTRVRCEIVFLTARTVSRKRKRTRLR